MADVYRSRLAAWLGLATLLGACATAELPRECVPPDPPTGLTVISLSKLRIRATWSHSGNADVVFHPEQSSDGGDTWQRMGNTRINGRTLTFVSLREGVTYRYRVRAHNRCGVSAWSNAASAEARR